MATAIFCKATEEFQAEAIVYELKAAGFIESAISVQIAEPNSILITVQTHTPQETEAAKEIFNQTEALDISIGETAEVHG